MATTKRPRSRVGRTSAAADGARSAEGASTDRRDGSRDGSRGCGDDGSEEATAGTKRRRRTGGAAGDAARRPRELPLGGGDAAEGATTGVAFSHDEIARHASAFLSWRERRADDDASSSGQRRKEPLDAVAPLARFLEAEPVCVQDAAVSEVAITREDVATLLLPWAAARLMRTAASVGDASAPNNDDAADALAWRALAGSLGVLSPGKKGGASDGGASPHEARLSSSLSQGALNRLVPRAARVAFGTDAENPAGESIQVCASRSFVHMARRCRPPFDGACRGLLREVDELAFGAGSSEGAMPAHRADVVRATLSMVRSLMSGANAKKLFATLSSGEVLPRLGRLMTATGDAPEGDEDAKDLVRDILREGLFHPDHHVEGFRAVVELQSVPPLPRQSSGGTGEVDDSETAAARPSKEATKVRGGKSCFQSNLFASVQNLFVAVASDEGEAGEAARKRRDAAAAANLLPTLMRGFFERIRDGAPRRSGGGGEAEARLQFRFWCRLLLPALELLFRLPAASSGGDDGNGNDELSLALLRAAAEALGLVLEFDAYLPSHADPHGAHLGVMEYVAEGLVRRIDGGGSGLGSDRGEVALVASFRHLLRLNHRLLHQRLASVVSFACLGICPSDDGQSQLRTRAIELLSAMVKIYRELRQVGHFLSATRDAFSISQGGNASFMNNLLDCGNVVESLSMAYQSCPSGQLQEIWHFFDGWIVDIVAQKFGQQPELPQTRDTDAATAELSFATQMFVIFLRNVRANKQNSPELRSLCEKSATSSVADLLGKARGKADIAKDSKGNRGILMRHGFDLCGWLVDMHTRSSFWIDDVDANLHRSSFLFRESGGSDDLNVLAYLRDVADATISTERYGEWKASWLHRYWEGNDLEEFSDIDVPLSLRGSLQRLALHRVHQLHSMIYYRNLRENEEHALDPQDAHSSSSALTTEAKVLVEFSLYIAWSQLRMQSAREAAEDLSESLWLPVAQSLCIWTHYCEPLHAELFLIWFFTTLCQDNCEAPSQLLRLEKNSALTLVRDASFFDVSDVMALYVKVGTQYAFATFLSSIDTAETISHESGGVTASCIELAMKKGAKLSLKSSVSAVAEALSIVASTPLELALCNENLYLLDRVVGLDILASQVIRRELEADECIDPRLLNIITSTKTIMANILPKILLVSSGCDAPCLAKLATQLAQNVSGFRSDEGVVSACCNAVQENFSLCVDYHEKEPRMLESFFAQMKSVVDNAAGIDFDSNALRLSQSVIRTMNSLDRQHSLPKKSSEAIPSPYELCLSFVWHVHRQLEMAGSCPDYGGPAASVLLLKSEILSFFGRYIDTPPATNLMTINQKEAARESVKEVFESIEGVNGSKHGIEFILASHYFLASMAAVPGFFLRCVPPTSVLKSLLGALAYASDHGRESPLLDAALCSLIRNADLEQTKYVTASVLPDRDIQGQDLPFVIKIFHSLLVCANSKEQHEHISGKCRAFLMLSVGLLRGGLRERGQIRSDVELFAKTTATLISKKELLLFRGREIAMICCGMNPLFHRGRDRDNGDDEADAAIFKSCCSVVASLIAHYPKQLYGCPSPLFSLLLALLSDILQTSDKKCLTQNCREYAKVCELLIPHKDIFKKHVIGLVLAYIRALNEGMNPTSKSKLMPSVYALLDMCSEFETRQINAMIDVPSKTLFAPVFQSYRKYYQYHGQT